MASNVVLTGSMLKPSGTWETVASMLADALPERVVAVIRSVPLFRALTRPELLTETTPALVPDQMI